MWQFALSPRFRSTIRDETFSLLVLQRERSTSPSPLDASPDDNNEIVVCGYVVDVDDQEGLRKELEHFFAKYLKRKAKVVHVNKIRYDLFKVTVTRYVDKLAILVCRDRLKKERPFIYVYSEKVDRDRKIHGKLRHLAFLEKAKGNDVRESYRKIIVNGNEWKWSDKANAIIMKVIMAKVTNKHNAFILLV